VTAGATSACSPTTRTPTASCPSSTRATPAAALWGVQVFEHGGVEYVAASDRDDGLYIFRHDPED
jgi:hypothetical protein